MEGFEWLIDVRDGISNPARQMTQSLKSVEAEMRKLQQTQLQYKNAGFGQGAQEVGKDLSALRLRAGELRAGLRDMGEEGKRVEANWGGLAALSPAATFALVGAAASAAAIGVATLAYEGGKLAIEMSELRERSTQMFTGLSGSAAGGEEMYSAIQKLRKVLPESERDLGQWAAKLMGAGMVDPRSVQESIKAMSSASALMGGGEQGKAAAEKVSNLIAKSLEGGKFKGMAKALVGTGVSADDLAKQLGMTPEAFQLAFKKGTIAADKGIDALNDVLQRKGVGALSNTMGEVAVMGRKVGEAWAHMFDAVDVKPIVASFRQMVSVLDTTLPSGRAMKMTITDAFNAIVKAGAVMVRDLTIGFLYTELAVLRLMHVLAPVILQFREWQKNGTAAAAWNLMLGTAAVILVTIGVAIGAVVLAAIRIGQAFMWAVQKVLELKQAVTGVGQAAPNMTKVMTGHASTLSGAGGAGGIEIGTAPAHASGGRVMQPASGEVFASVAPGEIIIPRGGANGSEGAQAGGSSRSITVDVGGIHIDGAGKSAKELLALVEAQIADLFERAALEAGG